MVAGKPLALLRPPGLRPSRPLSGDYNLAKGPSVIVWLTASAKAMPRLSDYVENFLNETRMLLLGGQVLLGFGYRICFEPAFERLAYSAQLAEVTSLAILTAAMGLLVWPVPFHQIAEQGQETEELHNFASKVVDWTLLLLAVALGLSFYPVWVALRLSHPGWIAAATSALALVFWYGGILGSGSMKNGQEIRGQDENSRGEYGRNSELSDRIKKVLMECRMALPERRPSWGSSSRSSSRRGSINCPDRRRSSILEACAQPRFCSSIDCSRGLSQAGRTGTEYGELP